jgi:error-prone DNA polymerase
MAGFAHLHVHSHWSLLSGAWAVTEIAAAAARVRLAAIALTDTDALHGAIGFVHACEAVGVKPLLGAELTDPARAYRAVFLARDRAGYEELCALVTARWLDPAFTLKHAVGRRSDHLAVMTRDHRLLEAAVAAGRREGTYAEVRPAPQGDSPVAGAERALRRMTLDWAQRLGLSLVATTGAYYETPVHRPAHELLRAIALRATLAALRERERVGAPREAGELETGPFAPETAWLMTGERLAQAFADCPRALEEAARLAADCRAAAFDLGALHMPAYPLEPGESAFAELWRLAFEGLVDRYRPVPERAIRRLQEELDVIEEKRFAPVFLVIRDLARWAAERHIPLVGRGSAANSLVSYCLGITHVDPLAHNLFFERFLSRERADPPDFDLDFCWRRRDMVIERVYERYGDDRVAMIATFCRLGARGALREVARALGVPDREISRVTHRVPHFASVETLLELRHALPECRGLPLDRPPWDDVLELALQIDMYPRHIAVHPGGIVIGPKPLDHWVPRQRAAKGVLVTQFDMHGIEDVGLVKIDLLGNRGLSAIADVADLLREEEGLEIRWAHDEGAADRTEPVPGALTTIRHVNPFRDDATRRIMRAGRTMGCFYIESPSMRALLKKLHCDSFEMLTAASSIIRPGIADSGMMDAFVHRFRGEEPVEYLHPVMAELLSETYGVMIYQEDVMKVVHRLAGMTLGEADQLRRSMAKKGDYADLETYHRRFLEGAIGNGVEPAVAEEIWRQIASFAGYSFCKAHSASYAQVSFQSAYLKAHWPAAFMASVLANGGGYYPAFAYVEEARRMGLDIRLPDVNLSGATWKAEVDTPGTSLARSRAIRAGLGQIAGLEAKTVAWILAERARAGPFLSLAEALARVAIPLAEVHQLIDVGAFDAFDLTRPQAKWKAELLLRERARNPARPSGETPEGEPRERGLFPAAVLEELAAGKTPVPPLPDYPVVERRRREWEILGVSPRHHPIEFWHDELATLRRRRSDHRYAYPAILARDLGRHRGQRVTVAGFLATTKRVRTKHDEPMMFLTLEDETDIYDVVVFPRVYQRDGGRFDGPGPYVVTGRVEDDPRPSTVTAETVRRLVEIV